MGNATLYEFTARTVEGKDQSLADYKGNVLLVVNVASECGFTPQYQGLEELHRKFKDRGFAVLGFPCNQFGAQEPGSEAQIKSFCETRFGVSFPLFAKIDVNGPAAHPLYDFLKSSEPGLLGTEAIKWNFTKFLVDRSGNVKARYAPTTKPEDLTGEVEAML
jgi:glutathione peroxidase